ncbi:AfsA-related hotdog domain-containing protein [Cellulomonas cellasea]|nr:AfsA-related hotdog domain-containing protein [Cellulomonas cellasea]
MLQGEVHGHRVPRTTADHARRCGAQRPDDRGPPARPPVGAQLPPQHGYFGDHTGRVPRVDPLLLLECCRQAETLVAHAYLGVPLGQHFVLRSWDMAFPGIGEIPVGYAPPTLRLLVEIEQPRTVHGVLRSLTYRVTLFVEQPVGESEVGHLSTEVMFASPMAYRALRDTRRRTTLVTSAGLRDTPVPPPVEPALVARTNERNVVLTSVEADEREVRGVLRLPFANPSLFDHAQDHVPAMVLTEAARQLALVALADTHGLSTQHTHVSAITGRFLQYVELDEPTVLHLELPSPPVRAAPDHPPRSTAAVRVVQGDRAAATIELALDTLPGPLAVRRAIA